MPRSGRPLPRRQPLGELDAHQQRADQAGPLRYGDGIQISEQTASLGEGRAADGRDRFQLRARGQLRVDAAIRRVQLDLRGDNLRAHPPPILDDRRRRLITRALDTEDQGHAASVARAVTCGRKRARACDPQGRLSRRVLALSSRKTTQERASVALNRPLFSPPNSPLVGQ